MPLDTYTYSNFVVAFSLRDLMRATTVQLSIRNYKAIINLFFISLCLLFVKQHDITNYAAVFAPFFLHISHKTNQDIRGFYPLQCELLRYGVRAVMTDQPSVFMFLQNTH